MPYLLTKLSVQLSFLNFAIMELEVVFGTYQRYKIGTKSLINWPIQSAQKCGYDIPKQKAPVSHDGQERQRDSIMPLLPCRLANIQLSKSYCELGRNWRYRSHLDLENCGGCHFWKEVCSKLLVCAKRGPCH